jgi:hypothetical protein
MNQYPKPTPDARGADKEFEQITAGPLPDIDALEVVADWREDLTMRIRRARLRQEFHAVGPEEIIALSAETEEFKHLVQALKGVIA